MQRTLEIMVDGRASERGPHEIYRAVCEDCAEHVDADLVSIWLFDASRTSIVRAAAYDAESGIHSADPMRLSHDDSPEYFRHIREQTVIAASDACGHPMTRTLADSYFRPLGIVSMLDFIIHRHEDFAPIGVICCENRGHRRDWSEADINYLRRIAALTSRHFSETP